MKLRDETLMLAKRMKLTTTTSRVGDALTFLQVLKESVHKLGNTT